MIEYQGYTSLNLSDEELADFYNYSKKEDYINHFVNQYNIIENEYIILDISESEKDKYCFRNNRIEKVKFSVLGNNFTGQIKPRNLEQELAFDMIKNSNSTIKLITGGFGSGKTLAFCNAAIEAVSSGKFDKIVWVRNNIQVKDTDPLGALPGDAFDKLLPFVMPLADHAGGVEGIRTLLESGQLEVIPLGFLRGRSIRNSIIFSTEAENLTKEHLQLLIGRVDEGSNLWMDADFKQRDKNIFERSAGLETMINKLKGNPLFGYVNLIKTERSKTAQLADLLD